MPKKKKPKGTKRPDIEKTHGVMRKTGPMKHRSDKRREQRDNNYDRRQAND